MSEQDGTSKSSKELYSTFRGTRGKTIDFTKLDSKKVLSASTCHSCRENCISDEAAKCTFNETPIKGIGQRPKYCHKRYCFNCLRQDYPTIWQEENYDSKRWKCPACLGICRCNPCTKKRNKLENPSLVASAEKRKPVDYRRSTPSPVPISKITPVSTPKVEKIDALSASDWKNYDQALEDYLEELKSHKWEIPGMLTIGNSEIEKLEVEEKSSSDRVETEQQEEEKMEIDPEPKIEVEDHPDISSEKVTTGVI
mmetsp:Transcript_55370/g.63284  ORF Transcript_55370/g.63284 Transcript_55370/m.63284 type:complete len:254 (+) Transcript_55370:47-808(+)